MNSVSVSVKTHKETTSRFYSAVRNEYFKMKEVKKKGVQFYSPEYIMTTLADKYYRSPKTIENILFNRV